MKLSVCKNALLVFCSVAFFSCQEKKPVQANIQSADTLGYVIIKDSVLSTTKINGEASIASIEYPIFKGEDVATLNDSLLRDLLWSSEMADGEVSLNKTPLTPSGLNQFLKSYIDDFEAFVKETSGPDGPIGGPWSQETIVQVLRQTPDLIAVGFDTYMYSGGAHPNRFYSFVNYTRQGRRLTLKDFFLDNTQNELNAIAESLFRSQEKLKPSDSLADGYFFDGGRFTLNDNFTVKPDGLLFSITITKSNRMPKAPQNSLFRFHQ